MQNKKVIFKNSISIILAILLGLCPVTKNFYGQPELGSASSDLPLGLGNIWDSMGDKFNLDFNPNRFAIQKEIHWFTKNQDYVTELTRNAKPYIYFILQETVKRGMPAELALIPMIESNYNPFVSSKCGASGLWQMMPDTASGFGIKMNLWVDGRRNIIHSTDAALDYLNYLHRTFKDWLLAVAAYNSGEGTVLNAIRYNKRHHKPTNFWSLPLPQQTKVYVPKLLALAKIIKNPDQYNLKLAQVADKPFFKKVDIKNQQIDLNRVAKVTNLAKADVKQIKSLNADLRHATTPPHDSYVLLLPIEKAEVIQRHLHELANASPTKPHVTTAQVTHHKVLAHKTPKKTTHHHRLVHSHKHSISTAHRAHLTHHHHRKR